MMIGDNYSTDMLGAMNVGLDTIYFNPNKIQLFSESNKDVSPAVPTHVVHTLSEIQQIL